MRVLQLLFITLLMCSIVPAFGSFDEGDDGDGGDISSSIPSIPITSTIPMSKRAATKSISIKEFTINVQSIKIDIDKSVKKCESSYPGSGPIITPIPTPEWPIDTPTWPDIEPPNDPDNSEVVCGEVDTQSVNVTTQGLPGLGLISHTPVISSFTYKIESSKVVIGKPSVNTVTFIIRGKNFDVSSLLGNDPKLIKQLGNLLEPKVYLGSICLTVCKFTNTYIEARFEDIDDQKNFKPGSYQAKVKVLSIFPKKPTIGIESTDSSTQVSTLGGLTLPELSIIGPSFPVHPIEKNPLISLFNGLKFEVAELLVSFSTQDADKISKCAKVI